MSVRITPRQAQGKARLDEMLETVKLVRGDRFAAVAMAAVQARAAMRLFDLTRKGAATVAEREQTARDLMNVVRQLASVLALPPGQLAEALRHARVMFHEGFDR